VAVSVLWVRLQKSKYLNFDVRNIFAGSHTKHRWGCSYIILPYYNKPTATRKSLSWALFRCSFIYFSNFFLQFPHPEFQPKTFRLRMCPTPEQQCRKETDFWFLGEANHSTFPAYPHGAQQQTSTDLSITRCYLDRLLALAWGRIHLGQYLPYPVSAVIVRSVLSLPGFNRSCRISTNISRLFLFLITAK